MDVYEVIADPTRRRILELVSERERPAGELSSAFAMSGPAVSRHLRVLREAGLVRCREAGTRRLYRLSPEPLEEIDAWIATTRRAWSERLDDLADHLDTLAAGNAAETDPTIHRSKS